MRRHLPLLALAALLMAAVAALAQGVRPTPPPFGWPGFEELVGRAHLAGCALREHPPGDSSPCVEYQRALLAAHEADVRRMVREARQDDAALARRARTAEAAADAIDRRTRE